MYACVYVCPVTPMLSGPSPAAQLLRVHWMHRANQVKEDSTAELVTSEVEEDIRCRYMDGLHSFRD